MSTIYEAIARRLGITLLPVSLNIFELSGDRVASFPGLPRFCSLVAFTIIMRKQKSSEKQGRPGNTYQVNDVWWTWGGPGGGQCPTTDLCAINYRVFLVALPLLCIILSTNQRTKKWGKPGNEARGCVSGPPLWVHFWNGYLCNGVCLTELCVQSTIRVLYIRVLYIRVLYIRVLHRIAGNIGDL